jgi:hypothetical protein
MGARLVVRYRKVGSIDELGEDLGGDLDRGCVVGWCGEGRKLSSGKAVQGVAARRGNGLDGGRTSLFDDELDVAFGHGLDSIEQIPRGQRHGSRSIDLRRHHAGNGHVEIRGRDVKPMLVGTEKHIGQHRHGAAPVGYALATLQQANETLLFGNEIHGGALLDEGRFGVS